MCVGNFSWKSAKKLRLSFRSFLIISKGWFSWLNLRNFNPRKISIFACSRPPLKRCSRSIRIFWDMSHIWAVLRIAWAAQKRTKIPKNHEYSGMFKTKNIFFQWFHVFYHLNQSKKGNKKPIKKPKICRNST